MGILIKVGSLSWCPINMQPPELTENLTDPSPTSVTLEQGEQGRERREGREEGDQRESR